MNRLGEFVGETVTTCGLVVEQRTHHQITGEPMKSLSLADWTGIVETELFAPTYKSYGLATVRYPVLEIEARVEHSRTVAAIPCAHCELADQEPIPDVTAERFGGMLTRKTTRFRSEAFVGTEEVAERLSRAPNGSARRMHST